MTPSIQYDDYHRTRATELDLDESPKSIRALSAFDRLDDASNGAASPTIPMRNRKHANGSSTNINIVEQIAYDPAFRNTESTRGRNTHIQPSPRTSSLSRPWENGAVGTPQDDTTSTLGGFDDFATEEEVRIARNGRTMSFSTMASRRDGSPHSLRSMASSHAPSMRAESRAGSRAESRAESRAGSRTGSRAGSRAGSVRGGSSLPGLQIRGNGTDHDTLEPLAEEDIDPASFDLVAPVKSSKTYDLENQSVMLFSRQHLAVILDDPILLQRFTNYLHRWRPDSVPLMVYYLNALKALKALSYANALTMHLQRINGLAFTADKATLIKGQELRSQADKAFQELADQDLPAFVTQTYIQTVSITVKRRIAAILPPELQEQSEGLAEVFCLTDPSRPDNPIIFASEQFHETTRYGMNNVIGRNCRFLQGPKTNPLSVKRIRAKLDAGKDHCETFLNYRRDGQPFMNLLMVAPLMDSRGVVRYHIGAQVDVSGLVKSRAGLESSSRLVDEDGACVTETVLAPHEERKIPEGEDELLLNPMEELRSLSEMLNLPELKTVRESGGAMHRIQQEDLMDSESVHNWHKPRVMVRDDATIGRRDSDPTIDTLDDDDRDHDVDNGGRLSGVFQHYLLVRPYPNLRVLFASPSLRVPGMLQSPFMDRIGGSSTVRHTIKQAFADGNGITAKVRWTTRTGNGRGRPRWIHCTPLLGQNKSVGVWMVVITDDEHGDEQFS